MSQQLKKYTSQFKADVVMELLCSGRKLVDVAAEYGLNPTVLGRWKREFLKKSHTVFDRTYRHKPKDMTNVADTYMKRIRQLREEKGMSQEQIAKMLGTSQTMYARYENGASKMPIRHLMMLASHYEVTTDYMLGLSDERQQG